MRLTTEQRDIINTLALEIFGTQAQVHLFGSRLDDNAKGGDIDLLVVSDLPLTNKLTKKLTFQARLQMALGDRKFDVIIRDPSTSLTTFHQQVLLQAERL